MSAAVSLVIGVAIFALILRGQLREKSIREEGAYRFMLILGALGIAQLVEYAGAKHPSAAVWAVLVVEVVIGIGFGALRGALIHVWRDNGQLVRKGNALTVALWVIGFIVHFGIDAIADRSISSFGQIGQVALMFYFACTLIAQRAVTIQRGGRLAANSRPAMATPADPA